MQEVGVQVCSTVRHCWIIELSSRSLIAAVVKVIALVNNSNNGYSRSDSLSGICLSKQSSSKVRILNYCEAPTSQHKENYNISCKDLTCQSTCTCTFTASKVENLCLINCIVKVNEMSQRLIQGATPSYMYRKNFILAKCYVSTHGSRLRPLQETLLLDFPNE